MDFQLKRNLVAVNMENNIVVLVIVKEPSLFPLNAKNLLKTVLFSSRSRLSTSNFGWIFLIVIVCLIAIFLFVKHRRQRRSMNLDLFSFDYDFHF